jgi:hypothetical protein
MAITGVMEARGCAICGVRVTAMNRAGRVVYCGKHGGIRKYMHRKTASGCYKTKAIAGTCDLCKTWLDSGGHIHNERFWCWTCCPVCGIHEQAA